MNEIRTLLALELRALYGINKYRHTKDIKEKNRFRMLVAAWIILIATAFSYAGGLVYGLCTVGLHGIVPAYLVVLASLLTVVFGIFTAGSRIFGSRGYDILASMPLKARSVVISRFLALYLEDLLFTLLILVPGLAVYGILQRPNIGFYLVAALGTVLLPAVPVVASVLFGTLVMAVSSRMKRKAMVQTALMLTLVLAGLAGSFRMSTMAEDFTPEAFAQLAGSIATLFGKLYPPAMWLNHAMLGTDISGLLWYTLLSLAAIALTVWLTAKCFHSLLRRLQSLTAGHDYKISTLESRGLLKALYMREAKRYFSSSIYVTNTIIGPILGAMMAISLCFFGVDSIQSALPVDITALFPFALAAVFCTMTTSCTSISMEGRQFWVIKSLPIPTKALLDSKLLLNFSLMLPFYVIAVVAMAIALQPEPWQLLWLLLIPGSCMVFSVIFGITVNLKFHSFQWEKEEAVVKQSLPAALGGFSGFLLAAALGIAAFFTPAAFANAVNGLMCLLLLLASRLLYRKNNSVLLSEL